MQSAARPDATVDTHGFRRVYDVGVGRRSVVAGLLPALAALATSCTVICPTVGALRAASEPAVDNGGCVATLEHRCPPGKRVEWVGTIGANVFAGLLLDLAAFALIAASLPHD